MLTILWKGIILALDFDQAKIFKKSISRHVSEIAGGKKEKNLKQPVFFLKDRLFSKKQNVY